MKLRNNAIKKNSTKYKRTVAAKFSGFETANLFGIHLFL